MAAEYKPEELGITKLVGMVELNPLFCSQSHQTKHNHSKNTTTDVKGFLRFQVSATLAIKMLEPSFLAHYGWGNVAIITELLTRERLQQ